MYNFFPLFELLIQNRDAIVSLLMFSVPASSGLFMFAFQISKYLFSVFSFYVVISCISFKLIFFVNEFTKRKRNVQ